jgi:hypothetical protein
MRPPSQFRLIAAENPCKAMCSRETTTLGRTRGDNPIFTHADAPDYCVPISR